ncbi:MAG: prolipoprotein diacylglyceryl transferase [Methylobacterium sp.]|nr:prolipoprotein diacylglyceryl transferase [Methylobacterium sp.]MCE2933319.1 prolipoprotein diacylglyceryl transferase [Hyphomicrobiales bacterium]
MLLPQFDPVAFSIGPLVVRWYALAYILGLLGGWYYARQLAANARLWPEHLKAPTPEQLDDLLVYAAFGVVIGGRLGFAFFYHPGYFLENPLEIVQVWKGGMAFHGGLFGAGVAVFLWARRNGLNPFSMLDIVAAVAPLGLMLGRIANFVNGELWGRVSDVPWAFIFPAAGPLPRHPSQLYEAATEGLLLLVVLAVVVRKDGFAHPGRIAGLFGMGYAATRIFCEFFREPDRHLGFLAGDWVTMGMVLSVPMALVGFWLYARAGKKPVTA